MSDEMQMDRSRMNGTIPYLMVRGAAQAIDFYKRAFAAEELARLPTDDGSKLMHAHLRINGGDVMVSDEFPEYGQGIGDGPRGVTVFMPVDDADAWYERAIEAGATVNMPIADQFWGDRFGEVRDPFGHSWAMGSPIKK